MTRIDKILSHLQFSIDFAKRYYKQLHKWLDLLNDLLAKNFPDAHLWDEKILTTIFSKTYTHIFNVTPIFLPNTSREGTYYVIIDTIELNPSISLLLYPYRSVWMGITFRVENIPLAFRTFFDSFEVKHSSSPYAFSFRTGLFLGFHYYGPYLPYHLQATTILCARALKVLTILKTIVNMYPLPSPQAQLDELRKYWDNVVALINLLKEEDDENVAAT